MRLSGWRSRAPGKEGLNQTVLDSVGAVLAAVGADADPHCWVTWADEIGSRWTLLAPCSAGLAAVTVRAGGVGEGSRVSGRLIRWSKVQVGELAAEAERGHRLVMFQVEGQPIRGTDDNADDVAGFAALTLAGLEGRSLPNLDAGRDRRPAVPGRAASMPASRALVKVTPAKAVPGKLAPAKSAPGKSTSGTASGGRTAAS